MIGDGYITYPLSNSPNATWKIENPVLNAFVTGALATVLAYQATALILDLFLGIKKSGEVKLTDLFTLFRSEDFSLAFLIRNFNCKRARSCQCTEPHKAKVVWCRSGPEEVEHIRGLALVKLLFLLVMMSVVNIVSIIMTLERNTVLSFRDAKFGGMSLGLNKESRQVVQDLLGVCAQLRHKYDEGDVEGAIFYDCFSPVLKSLNQSNSSRTIGVATNSEGLVSVFVNTPEHVDYTSKFVDVDTIEGLYRLQQTVTIDDAKDAIIKGSAYLPQRCRLSRGEANNRQLGVPQANNRQLGVPQFKIKAGHDGLEVTVPFECSEPLLSSDEAFDIAFHTRQSFSVVETNTFEVAKIDNLLNASVPQLQLASGDHLPFLRKRLPYVSLFGFCIAVVVVTLSRVIVKMATHNDIHLGIELMVKSRLGLNLYDSMLQNTSVVRYGLKPDGVDYSELHRAQEGVCG